MPIRFLPLGIIISSSHAATSSIAASSKFVPVTASLAGHAINLQGATGSAFLVIAAPTSSTPPYGLVQE